LQRTDTFVPSFKKSVTPPSRRNIEQWAEENMRYDMATDSAPRYILTKSPYHKFIFACWLDQDIEEIFVLMPTQSGKTAAMVILLCYVCAEDPGPVIFVQALEDPTKAFIRDRLKPTMRRTFPNLVSEKIRDKNWTDDKGAIIGGTHFWPAWSRSAGRLIQWPRRYVFGDEVARWACSRHLVFERTKQFPHNRKAFWTTTPTYKHEQSWVACNSVFRLYRWWVPCSLCGAYQILEFENLVYEHCKKSNGNYNFERLEHDCKYKCKHCNGLMTEKQRAAIVQKGIPDLEDKKMEDRPKRQTSFRITSLDVPNISWGETVRKYLESKKNPADLENFYNSWLVLPYEPQHRGLNAEHIMRRATDVELGRIPDDTKYLLLSVDVQFGHVWLFGRAFMNDGRSQLVIANRVDGDGSTRKALARVWKEFLSKGWQKEDGEKKWSVPWKCSVDCGDGKTYDAVIGWCHEHYGKIWPFKGRGRNQRMGQAVGATWTKTVLDKYPNGKPMPRSLPLYWCKTSYYREKVIGAFHEMVEEKGAWLIAKGTPEWYAKHLEAWQVVKGKWEQISEHDHALDGECYISCMQDIMQAKMRPEAPIRKGVDRQTTRPIRRRY